MGSSKSWKITALLSKSANWEKIITNLISSKRQEFSNFWKSPFLVKIGSLYYIKRALFDFAGVVLCVNLIKRFELPNGP